MDSMHTVTLRLTPVMFDVESSSKICVGCTINTPIKFIIVIAWHTGSKMKLFLSLYCSLYKMSILKVKGETHVL